MEIDKVSDLYIWCPKDFKEWAYSGQEGGDKYVTSRRFFLLTLCRNGISPDTFSSMVLHKSSSFLTSGLSSNTVQFDFEVIKKIVSLFDSEPFNDIKFWTQNKPIPIANIADLPLIDLKKLPENMFDFVRGEKAKKGTEESQKTYTRLANDFKGSPTRYLVEDSQLENKDASSDTKQITTEPLTSNVGYFTHTGVVNSRFSINPNYTVTSK